MPTNDDGQEVRRLARAARQLLDTDRSLGGETIAPGAPLPEQRSDDSGPPPAPEAPPAGPEATAKAAQLEAIDVNEVRGCRLCRLCEGRTNTVFGEGNPDADIVFIGEGPGADEDRLGRPFVGRAGRLLTNMIRAMGLTRRDVYIANLVKCRPPGNRAPMVEEVESCWDYLVRQLRIISPRVIVTLGNPATHRLLDTTVGITRMRGQWRTLPLLDPALAGVKVMPTFHPAYLLRSYNRDTRQKIWSDLQTVMAEVGLSKP